MTNYSPLARPDADARHLRVNPTVEECKHISRTLPLILLLLSTVLVLIPTNRVLVGCAFVSSLVCVRALFIIVLRPGHLRLTWLLATGLLLGYGLGTFNTSLRMLVDGFTLSQATPHREDALCIALAVSMAVSAVLYFVGSLVDPPVRLNWSALSSSDQIFLWASLAITAIAYLTQGMGYMGVKSDQQHKESIIGALASIVTPTLPAFTVLLVRKSKHTSVRFFIWMLLAMDFAALLPQGRRIMLYSVVVVFVALTLRGLRFTLANPRTIILLLVAGLTLYFGNKLFFAMRYQRNQAGRRANLSLTDNIQGAIRVLGSGDKRYDAQLQQNLRERTLVLGYFSDLLGASWRREPMWGKALLFDIREAVPSALDPNKDVIRNLGMEETVVNPQFGLQPKDEANSILTTGLADFGVLGCFLYPLVLSLALGALVRRAVSVLPAPVGTMFFFSLVFVSLQTEMTTSEYMIICRNWVILSVGFLLLAKLRDSLALPQQQAPAPVRASPAIRNAYWIFLTIPFVPLAKPQTPTSFSLSSFDATCGHPGTNCRPAFQRAFKAIAAAGGGTLLLPAGTLPIDFPEIVNNTNSAPPLQQNSLLLVPPKTAIRGHRAADGTPDTFIEWSVTSIPLFVLFNSSFSSVEDIHFRFTGVTPSNYPYGDVSLLKALGLHPTYPHRNQMSGNNAEISSVLYLLGSEHCRLDHLVFDSKTRDNDHVLGFGIVAKGKNVHTEGGGGGLTGLAVGNEFTNISLYDYVMGMLISGQQDLRLQDISADRRGSTKAIAPGHLIYVTFQFDFNPGRETVNYPSKNIEIRNILDGPNTHGNVVSLGTLAIKNVEGGLIDHVVSHHPLGLLQTIVSDKNVTFHDMVWESDQRLCEQTPMPENCYTPVINSTAGDSMESLSAHLTFKDIKLKSTYEPINCMLIGDHILVDNMSIETPPAYRKGQTASTGVLSVKRADDVSITGFKYIPRLSAFSPAEHYNAPFACWNPCSNVRGNVEIQWPASVDTPPANHRVISPTFQDQDKDPSKQIHVTTTVKPAAH